MRKLIALSAAAFLLSACADLPPQYDPPWADSKRSEPLLSIDHAIWGRDTEPSNVTVKADGRIVLEGRGQ